MTDSLPPADDPLADEPADEAFGEEENDAYGELAAEDRGWRTLAFTLLVAALALGGWQGVHIALQRGWMQEMQRSYSQVSLLPGPLVRPSEPDLEIQIYYVVGGSRLDYRTFKLRKSPSGDAERVDLIREALSNPADPDRFRSPLPGKATIRGVYIMDGIVWLDLSKEFQQADAPTPMSERLSVYALVNTFLLNAPDLQGVRFLIEGQPAETAWGWMDLSSPLGINLSLIG